MDEDRPRLKSPQLTPAEKAVRKGKISLADLRKRQGARKDYRVSIKALSKQEHDARVHRIQNEWGSLSNFCSAMIWYFTQGYVEASTIAGIRTSWETRWTQENFQELTEEEIKRALSNKAFLRKLNREKEVPEEIRDFNLEKEQVEELRKRNKLDEETQKDSNDNEVPIVQPLDIETLRDLIFKENKI
jgi:hypothetical protein